ncbi:MAG TPA: ATP-binding protein [Thermodesulfobacteriota bacterium]|nr:ATP-binding protein [Thermodesulfobacteriota bacterium]
MKSVEREQLIERINVENPWWKSKDSLPLFLKNLKPREYLDLFYPLAENRTVRRAVILMGPRRVGKTVMIHHTIERLIQEGFPSGQIVYFPVDHPVYNGLSLEEFIKLFSETSAVDVNATPVYVFFDEIQYLKNWEIHLKKIVDDYPYIKAVASGSAAAALKLKSNESGAGRFTDFLLPPLTFYEYLLLSGETRLVNMEERSVRHYQSSDINSFNRKFVDYINYGGYPEVVLSGEIKENPTRFIKSDIIDKVLLRDLPSLYGIQDIQELYYLFTTLALNTANEISLEELSRKSGVAKNTIKKYLEYLEAAFLIRIIHRVDRSGKKFKRANYFKVYLTNPSIRAALFSPIKDDDRAMGPLVETAVFSQWFQDQSDGPLYYARWDKGEVDLVSLGPDRKFLWAVEVKWSDYYPDHIPELPYIVTFCHANNLPKIRITTKTIRKTVEYKNISFDFVPASEYCFTVGFNRIKSRKIS